MSSQTSAPQSAAAGSMRRAKIELMRQWRTRSAVSRLVPGLFWVLWSLAVLLDVIVLASGFLLAGSVLGLLPAHVQPYLPRPLFSGWNTGEPLTVELIARPTWFAAAGCGLAAVALTLSLTMGTRRRFEVSALYTLGWLGCLSCLAAVGRWIVVPGRPLGPSPAGSLTSWLLWTALLVVVLGSVLELVSRHGWMLLAAVLSAGLLLLTAEQGMGAFAGRPVGSSSEWTMYVPGTLLAAGLGAYTLAWAIGLVGLVYVIVMPGQLEPCASLTTYASRCLWAGIALTAAALLLDWALDGPMARGLRWGQPTQASALALPLAAGFFLLARRRSWLGDFGFTFWMVVGLSTVCLIWVGWQLRWTALSWGTWSALLAISLAVHAAQRHLYWQPDA